MTLINPANDEKATPTPASVVIPKTEAERDAILSGASIIDTRLADLRARTAPLQNLMDEWNFRPVSESEQDAMVALLRGKHFGEPVAETKPILLHKVKFNDATETATVVQPWAISIVTSLATGQSCIMLGSLNGVDPVVAPRTDSRGLTEFAFGEVVKEVKRKNGRVVFNYDWRVVALRPVTEDDCIDDGLYTLAATIGEAFAETLVAPVEDDEADAPTTTGGIDFSAVSF